MTKATDVADLLGTSDKPTKAKPAAKTTPAKKVAAKAPAEKPKAAPAAKKAPAAKTGAKALRVKEPVVFEEGEREELIKQIKKTVKKAINSKELAEKLGIATRKLRRVLYSAQKQGVITLELSDSKAAGMTVSPA